MRVKFTFREVKGNPIAIPVHYNYLLQHLIYKVFSPDLRSKLYLEGFTVGTRRFKLFTFSRILERGKVLGNSLVFGSSISFYFSSAIGEIVSDFGINALERKEFKLGRNELALAAIEVLEEPRLTTTLYARMLSPMTTYSTFEKSGKKITHYFRPDEDEFQRILEENARKKYVAVMQALGYEVSKQDLAELKLKVVPHRYSAERNRHLVYFKNSIIEAYSGIYKIEGSIELIGTSYDTGLGAKNSEGFGMWEFWTPERGNVND
ncbi:CRISPR-associated endoribonuclease Cas6 [Coprothermobacteraceae bacterium]|nr:CRISPR-associated endoribonuclease Cas6 [Coprothermobacteraceae bacterium]